MNTKNILIMLIILGVVLLSGYLLFNLGEKIEEDEVIAQIETKEEALEIGQMLMIGFRGTTKTNYIKTTIKDLNIGGIVLFDIDVPSKSFPRNITDKTQVKELISDLQSFTSTTLFISVDAEGGLVNRLKEKYGFVKMPSHQELGNIGEAWNVTGYAQRLAKQLKELGFNMNFAPVVDLNINPLNPVIGKIGRSFSKDAFSVYEFSKAFIEAQKREGIISVVKHFPGHGSSKGDSHLGMVDVTEIYQKDELIPYQALQNDGLLQAVMTAHIINKNIDEKYPATLSSLHLNILRNDIGFKGVIISDDMGMKAIVDSYSLKNAVIRAINAGGDIILISNNVTTYDEQLPYKVYKIIKDAIEKGDITKERIKQSLLRIESLKKSLQ